MRVAGRVLAAAVAALTLAAASAPAEAGGPLPSRLLVTGTEFDLRLSRTTTVAGPAIVQFRNAGEDPHDLRMRRVGGERVHSVGELAPGQLGQFKVGWLRRGSRYRLWCSLPSHSEAGMQATLSVRRRGTTSR